MLVLTGAACSKAELVVDLAPGTYHVVCNLPGHFEKGIYATLAVT